MNINAQMNGIIDKYIESDKKMIYTSKCFLKEVIRKHIWEKEEKICIFGYKRDVDCFVKCLPKNGKPVMIEYAEKEDWKIEDGLKAEKQVHIIANFQIEKFVIVSEELRYLMQMYLINEDVSFKIVDIYDLIKRVYARVVVKSIANSPKDLLKEYIKQIGVFLSGKIHILGKLYCVGCWIRASKYCGNYDAILVKKNNVKIAKDKEEKKYYLNELIKNYILIKDFENAFLYIDEYSVLFGTDNNPFIQIRNELMDLFRQMKEQLHNRKEKDIIIFWCDSLPYHEFSLWHFLEKEAKDSLLFENAYTYVPYTNTTMQAIFTGEPFFEEKLYKVLESPNMIVSGKTLDLLKKNQYHICEVGGNYIQEKIMRKLANTMYTVKANQQPATILLWEMLAQLLENESRKQFIICHMDELHAPYWNGKSKKMQVCREIVWTNDVKTFETQRRESADYLEKTILWYTSFLGDNTSRIYMSDHGTGEPTYLEKRLHTFCFVKDINIVKGCVSDYFSYLNFYDLFTYILHPKEENFKKIFSEYILIQNDHPYGEGFVNIILRRLKNYKEYSYDKFMAFRGIIKDGYKLILFPTHEEFWFDFEDNKVNPIDIENQELVQFMRDRVGNEFPDIYTEEHYVETRKLYERCKISLKNI